MKLITRTHINAKKSKSNYDENDVEQNIHFMKKTILYILTISMLVVFYGCDKDYDYRDKWEGDYEYECFRNSELDHTGTLSVNKHAQDSILIIISKPISYSPPETLDFCYYFQVLENGTVRLPESNIGIGLCWSGRFKNRNNLELISYSADSGGEYTTTYQCKKI